MAFPLRHDEYCCCGHSERQKRRPSGCGYRDPPGPSRSKRHDGAHPRQQDRCFKYNPVICSRSRCRSHCHGRVRAFPAAGIYSWRDDTWYACLDDQTDIDVALIGSGSLASDAKQGCPDIDPGPSADAESGPRAEIMKRSGHGDRTHYIRHHHD